MSQTRWSARVACVRPFAGYVSGLRDAINDLFHLSLTPETRSTLNGIKTYLGTFKCLLLASTWVKVLTAIDQRNKILQLKDQTIDIELENIKSLLSDLELLKTNWEAILTECKAVASVMEIDPVIGLSRIRSRKRKRFYDEDEQIAENNEDETGDETEPGLDKFRKDTFDVLLNEVINQIKNRFVVIEDLVKKFGFLWKYIYMDDSELRSEARKPADVYQTDISPDIVEEILMLKTVHCSNIRNDNLAY